MPARYRRLAADNSYTRCGMNHPRQFSRMAIDYGLKEIRFDPAGLLVAEPAWSAAR
jgi:hypothetical protein